MTILSETTARTLNPIGTMFLVIIVILMLTSLCIVDYIDLVVGIIILIAIAMCFVAVMTIGTSHYRRIKAIISDEYSAADLYDKYDVKERDGAIWVLTEKEPMTEEDEE